MQALCGRRLYSGYLQSNKRQDRTRPDETRDGDRRETHGHALHQRYRQQQAQTQMRTVYGIKTREDDGWVDGSTRLAMQRRGMCGEGKEQQKNPRKQRTSKEPRYGQIGAGTGTGAARDTIYRASGGIHREWLVGNGMDEPGTARKRDSGESNHRRRILLTARLLALGRRGRLLGLGLVLATRAAVPGLRRAHGLGGALARRGPRGRAVGGGGRARLGGGLAARDGPRGAGSARAAGGR